MAATRRRRSGLAAVPTWTGRLANVDPQLLHEIEAFFVDEDRVLGRAFRVLKVEGRVAARRTARASQRARG